MRCEVPKRVGARRSELNDPVETGAVTSTGREGLAGVWAQYQIEAVGRGLHQLLRDQIPRADTSPAWCVHHRLQVGVEF